MITETVSFENYNGEIVTETLHFNITKTELMQAQAEFDGDFAAKMIEISESKDPAKIAAGFRMILRIAYGVRSEDGRHFRKSEEIWEDFVSSAAFDTFLWSLMTDGDKATRFVNSILPRDLRDQYEKALESGISPQDYLKAQNSQPMPTQQPHQVAKDPRSAWLEQQRQQQQAQNLNPGPQAYPQQ